MVFSSFCQTKIIHGYVYGNIYRTPIPHVQVYTSSGNKAVTDSNGVYTIPTNSNNDTIWFKFLNKETKKFPIDTITNIKNFEVRIYLPDYYKYDNELPTVQVTNRTYRDDSLQLREDYAKIFDYKKPWKTLGEGIGPSNAGNGGIGVDFDAILGLFRFGYNHRQLVYQKFAEDIEHDRYIDHRFNKITIEKYTGLSDENRDDYINEYRPKYDQLILMSDDDLVKYIKATYNKYTKEEHKQNIENNITIIPNDK